MVAGTRSGGLSLAAARNAAPDTREEAVMPNVIIQQLPKSPEAKRELVKRITDAIVDAYKSPAETVHVWIDEYPADGYAVAGKLVADK